MCFLKRYLKFLLLGFFCIFPVVANSEIAKDVLISSVIIDTTSSVKVSFLTMNNEKFLGEEQECADGFLLDIASPQGKRMFTVVLAAKTINGISDIDYSTGSWCALTALTLKYGQSVKGEEL